MVVDCFNHVPDQTSFEFQLQILACSKGYVQLFGSKIAQGLGLDLPSQTLSESELFSDLISRAKNLPKDRVKMLSLMDEAEVDITIVHAEDLGPSSPVVPLQRDYWDGVIDECRGRVKVLGSVHPARGKGALDDFKKGVLNGTYIGVFLSPFQQGVRIRSGEYKDIFDACTELNVPAWIHSGMHWDQRVSLDGDRPSEFDHLCVNHPNLRVIAGHAGWPWLSEMCALAWKHPNLFLEISAHRPRHFLRAGSGWESLLNYGATVIKHKVILGTASFLMGVRPKDIMDEYKALGLPERVLDQWLGANARQVYRLS
jgi:uncharacterized protein